MCRGARGYGLHDRSRLEEDLLPLRRPVGHRHHGAARTKAHLGSGLGFGLGLELGLGLGLKSAWSLMFSFRSLRPFTRLIALRHAPRKASEPWLGFGLEFGFGFGFEFGFGFRFGFRVWVLSRAHSGSGSGSG